MHNYSTLRRFGHKATQAPKKQESRSFCVSLCFQSETSVYSRSTNSDARKLVDKIHEFQVHEDIGSDNYNNYNYLIYKCKWIICLTTEFTDSIAYDFAKSITLTYNDIRNVKAFPMIRQFLYIAPSDGHSLDEFFRQNSARSEIVTPPNF